MTSAIVSSVCNDRYAKGFTCRYSLNNIYAMAAP